MAKNNYLFGIFLCVASGLCIGIGGVVVGSFQQSAISSQQESEANFECADEGLADGPHYPTSTVILSGTKCSRKISPLEAESVRHAISSFSATTHLISPFRYAPVEKTAVNGTFDATSLNSNLIRNQIRQIYTAEIGVREKTGKNDGERVEEYLAVTQLGKGYAWCAAFVSWVFAEAGFPEPRTPWSPGLFPKKRVIWERGKSVLASNVEESGTKLPQASTLALQPNTQNPTPVSGDVFGIYFANLKRIAHVGFVDEWGEKQIITVEGNTNEAGSGEGDGVYRKRRPIASIYQVANWIDQEVEQ